MALILSGRDPTDADATTLSIDMVIPNGTHICLPSAERHSKNRIKDESRKRLI